MSGFSGEIADHCRNQWANAMVSRLHLNLSLCDPQGGLDSTVGPRGSGATLDFSMGGGRLDGNLLSRVFAMFLPCFCRVFALSKNTNALAYSTASK